MAIRLLEAQRSRAYANVAGYQGEASATYAQHGNLVNLDFIYVVDAVEVTVPGTTRLMKNIAVTVQWANRYGPTQQRRTRTVTLETAVAP